MALIATLARLRTLEGDGYRRALFVALRPSQSLDLRSGDHFVYDT